MILRSQLWTNLHGHNLRFCQPSWEMFWRGSRPIQYTPDQDQGSNPQDQDRDSRNTVSRRDSVSMPPISGFNHRKMLKWLLHSFRLVLAYFQNNKTGFSILALVIRNWYIESDGNSLWWIVINIKLVCRSDYKSK